MAHVGETSLFSFINADTVKEVNATMFASGILKVMNTFDLGDKESYGMNFEILSVKKQRSDVPREKGTTILRSLK